MIDLVIPEQQVEFEGRTIFVKIDPSFAPLVERLIGKAHRTGRPIRVQVAEVYPRRRTGPGSASNHLHGHLAQLAEETGHDAAEMKQIMKESLPEWPSKLVEFAGEKMRVYASESSVNTAVEAAAIEWCHVKAAFLGIKLIETPYMQ